MTTIFDAIVRLLLPPLRFIYIKYLYLSGQAFYATIYLKSGNQFTILCTDFKLSNKSADGWRSVSWRCLEYNDILTLDPPQIEAITIRR
jgi:hypothetical protein